MTEDLEKVRELHQWNRRILSIGGMWPTEPTFVRFYLGSVYFTLNFIFAIGDFVNVYGDMSLMVANISETSLQGMVGVKMLVLRHSGTLIKIIKQVEDGARAENYRDLEEINLYLKYNGIGRKVFRILGVIAFSTELLYHLKPLEDIIKCALHNETAPFVLPYRIHPFFTVTETRTYALLYVSEGPMFYYYYCHTISVCFLCTLVVHVAGELSVLAYRIRSINELNSVNEFNDPQLAFRDIASKHEQIVGTAKAIDDVFNIVLLEELVTTTVLIGLTAHEILSKSVVSSMFEFFSFVSYSSSLVGLIFVYCLTGDFLIRESVNVHDAYYECRWYTMSSKHRKDLMICMARTQRPLTLTAGKFYIFELTRFGSVLKAAAAYISMFRNIV